MINPPLIESPPVSLTNSPTHIGYNPRKIANHNLRPNPAPDIKPDFRRLDAVTITQEVKQNQESKLNQLDYV